MSDNNEEISKWMVARDREAYRRDSEAQRLKKYRELGSEESRLRGEIQKQAGLFEAALAEQIQAARELEDAEAKFASVARHAELLRFEVSDLGGQLDRVQAKRQRLSPAVLTEFIAEAWRCFDETRAKSATYERTRTERLSGKMQVFFLSNSKAIDQALAIIRSVIDRAEQLKLEALSDKELEAAINKLRAELPDPVLVAQREERVDFAPLVSDPSPVRYA